MDSNSIGLLVAAVGFALAFGVAKLVSTAVRKRRQTRDEALAASQQSRQVRRAQARRNRS